MCCLTINVKVTLASGLDRACNQWQQCHQGLTLKSCVPELSRKLYIAMSVHGVSVDRETG